MLSSTKLLCLFVVCLPSITMVQGSCSSMGKCCPGRSNKCGATSNDGVCYCDEFCRRSNDCCSDYEYYCRPQDCILTYWSHWSECSSSCGKGRQERKREIHIPATGGGKRCKRRRQSRTCIGNSFDCRRKEVALIVPTYYKPFRMSGNKYSEEVKDKRASHCIHYYVSYVSPYCQYDTPWHMLKKGDTICVECEDRAMDEHGVCKGESTTRSGNWRGVATNNCFGLWKSVDKEAEDCECGYQHGFDYLFV